MTEPKLKPCPFCGGDNIMTYVGEIHNGVPCDTEKPYYLICCYKCGCVIDNYDNRTEADAIKVWNRRVSEVAE